MVTRAGLPARTRAARLAASATAALSVRLGLGDGTVIGGRAALALDPDALGRLGQGHRIALVSGTNGKSTTTRFLSAALATMGAPCTNPQGSNLPPGLVAGLARAAPGAACALEVDEGWLRHAMEALAPAVVVLLNLSRDQLDRVAEVRRVAARWREALLAQAHAQAHELHVVANADDPMVAWAAMAAPAVTWVAAGQPWRSDAASCPSCGARLVFAPTGPGWACASCSFARPDPAVIMRENEIEGPWGRHQLVLSLPGRANTANAAMALSAAVLFGVDPPAALAAIGRVTDVDGRYRLVHAGQTQGRVLLAKNPAGWLEVFDMLAPPPAPVVVAVNARLADGRDPSWLWDVPFERLAGRRVAAAGERSRDVAVRLRYAGVEHVRIEDPMTALATLGRGSALIDVALNYTAMRALLRDLGAKGFGRRVRGGRARA